MFNSDGDTQLSEDMQDACDANLTHQTRIAIVVHKLSGQMADFVSQASEYPDLEASAEQVLLLIEDLAEAIGDGCDDYLRLINLFERSTRL